MTTLPTLQANSQHLLRVNGKRLNQSLDDLAQIGRLENGGICRLAFSAEDIQGRELVRRWMVEAGLEVRIDTAGNMIGRLPGKQNLPALATGSHIDTVPCGGKFDGNLGVLAGIEVARTLTEHGIRLDHPLEVIAFADEEDTMIGSRAMAGTADLDVNDYRRKDGQLMNECVNRVGGNWDHLAQARRTRRDVCAFVELHVEQGACWKRLKSKLAWCRAWWGCSATKFKLPGGPTMPEQLRWISARMPWWRRLRWCWRCIDWRPNPGRSRRYGGCPTGVAQRGQHCARSSTNQPGCARSRSGRDRQAGERSQD